MEKRIQEIIDRCRAIDLRQDEIERAAELENQGKFTDEQRVEYTALKGEFDALISEKKTLETDAAMRNDRTGRADLLQPAALPRRAAPASGAAVVPPGGAIPGTPVDQTPTLTDTGEKPVVRFAIPRNVIRMGTLTNFRGVRDGLSAEERAFRFGMWALARISADIPNRYNFLEAKKFVQNYMGAPRNVAHGETGGVTGGEFLVPEEFSSDIIILREKFGVARRLFQRSVMTSDVKHEPKRATGLTAYFTGEGAAGTESNMSWQDIQLIAKDLMVLARMSNQLSMDAVISVGDTLAGEIAYAFSQKEDDCAFNGTGASAYGGIQGILNLLTSIDGAGADSAGLTVGTGSGWSGLVLADFNKCVGTLPQYADTENASWTCHRAFYYAVMQRLELAAGGATALETATGDRRPRPLFLGYPVDFAQIFPGSTAAGVMTALGDYSKGALFGDRSQTTIAFSEHATIGGQGVFEQNQIAIRGTERFDINVHGCGTATAVGPIVGLSCG